MKVKRSTLTGMMIITAALFALDAKADNSAAPAAAESSTASSGGLFDTIKKNGSASYLAWLTGPNTQALSGNVDGSGTNLTITHFASIGYKLTDKMSLSLTQPVKQAIDDKPNNLENPWKFTDPYFTLSHSSLVKQNLGASVFNLNAYLRYYVPISRGTHDTNNKGDVNDTGNGTLRVLANPSFSFFDGKLSLNGQSFVNFKFASLTQQERACRSGGNGEREDLYVVLNPSVSYQVSDKLEAYVEYATGYLRHHNNGKFVTNPRTPGDGQYVSPGVNWSPTKRVLLNPYLSWGPTFQGLKNTDIGLQAQYSFL